MRFGKHCSNVGFEGLKVSNSCSLRSLAILLRNKFEFAVYGIDAACGRYCRRAFRGHPWLKKRETGGHGVPPLQNMQPVAGIRR